jgi:phasin family protein
MVRRVPGSNGGELTTLSDRFAALQQLLLDFPSASTTLVLLQCSIHCPKSSPRSFHVPSAQDFAAVAQSNVDVLLAISAKAFEGAEKLAALNLQVAKGGLADAAKASSAVLSAKDPQSLLAVQAGAVQPAASKASEYATQVAAIMNETKSELDKVIAKSAAEAQNTFSTMIEAALKNAPAGSADAMALWKSAVEAANGGFEALQKAAKQATEVAQANYTAASNTVTKATKASRG